MPSIGAAPAVLALDWPLLCRHLESWEAKWGCHFAASFINLCPKYLRLEDLGGRVLQMGARKLLTSQVRAFANSRDVRLPSSALPGPLRYPFGPRDAEQDQPRGLVTPRGHRHKHRDLGQN